MSATTSGASAVEPWVMYHITEAEYHLHQRVIYAHGIILGIAFAFLYPFGATIIRAFSFKGVLWFHAGWQVFAYVLSIVGLGTGIWLVQAEHNLLSNKGHPIIGIIVIGLLLLMPPLGYIHHVLFVKRGGRTPITYIHRWLGRFAIVLGGINGGLGIWFTHDEPLWGIIAYTALAAFFYSQWFSVTALLEMIRRRKVAVDAAKENATIEEEEKKIESGENRPKMAYQQESEQSSNSGRTFVDTERELRVKV